ncbi:MAG: hypothetical protein IV100_25175 [Myxococcales bacterium]|nr:hypothetical protein [Myxococcales bacterium]
MTCPSCSSELPSPKFKFCPFCGAAIGASSTPARATTRSAVPNGAADTIAEPNSAFVSDGPATLFGRPPARVLASDTLPEPAPAIRTTGDSPAPARANSRAGSAKAAPGKAGKPDRTQSAPGGATLVDPPHARPDSEAATVFEIPAINAAALEEAVEKKRQGSKAGLAAPVRTDEIDSAMIEGAIRAAPRIREDDRPTVLNLAAVTGFDETRDHPAVPNPTPARKAVSGSAAAPSMSSPNPASSDAAADRSTRASPKRSTTGGSRPSSPKSNPVAPTTGPKVGVPETATPAGDRKKFSETAWFMAAVNPADLAEREGAAQGLAEADDMTERYAVDQPLPDEVRSKFSLRGLLGRSSKKKP